MESENEIHSKFLLSRHFEQSEKSIEGILKIFRIAYIHPSALLVPLKQVDNINTNSSNHIPPLSLGEVSAGRRGLIYKPTGPISPFIFNHTSCVNEFPPTRWHKF